ncbi:stage 0 sporulation family protein [Caldilinea sp.]|uniref:PSP1 domain-containing protein n=1 Tax=Caldilinea sp. TaxID=2293560 RepID=UPI002CC8E757|nr:stage 0 sporulation family protein [Anaerolineales bacterium]HQY90145.1 stage 0 sporulation family protein [Caldilinea sp.]HRA67239.1 stage 0 sporulation family protein [Caldilinea sp.]
MPVVVGVQFKSVTKVYHFDPDGQIDLGAEDFVIVDTARGPEVAQVVQAPHLIGAAEVVGEMKKVVRRASAWDLVQRDQWLHKEQEALALCKVKAKEHNLHIKLVRCEYSFDGGRLLIYFASEERVDFRALVRDLARVFRTRIEMRQIGVRDEAKLLDGVGKCGRQLCCTSWLREFTPVSIRMAKSQQLPLNPDEISGVCGRLLCCLSYEDDLYREQNKKMPKLGAEVITPHGAARVRHVHPLKESVTVMLENHALVEVLVAELISTKSASGHSCSTCGGCTTKRRAGAEEDNARARAESDRRKPRKGSEPAETATSVEAPASQRDSEEQDGRRKRKRRRPRNRSEKDN